MMFVTREPVKNFIVLLFGFLAFGSGAVPAAAQTPVMKVEVAAVRSIEDYQRWLKKGQAFAEGKGADPGPYLPSLAKVGAGTRVHFPIVVKDLRPPAQGTLRLVADFEVHGPDGKAVARKARCCALDITNRPDWRSVLLDNVPTLEMEPGDAQGPYTVRISVTDGSRTVAASHTLEFTAPPARSPPRLRAGTGPGGRDLRECLELATPSEVIKCSERK